MNEQPITFKNKGELISGILHLPARNFKAYKSIVVFLHGFAGYRIGPHQLFVKLARQLSLDGHTCIRFDFRGRGYSQGKREITSYKTMVSDLDVVLKDIHEQFHPTQLFLLGICSGTRTALYYIKNKSYRVDGLIGLSSPALTNVSNLSTTTRHTKSILQEYIYKAKNKENWRRLLKGETNTGMITRIINNNIKGIWFALCSKISIRTSSKKTKKAQNKNMPFSSFTGEVLLIHGERDPETPIALKQISGLLLKHNIPYQQRIIQKANHSFYSLKWEKEIIDLTSTWLTNKLNPVKIN